MQAVRETRKIDIDGITIGQRVRPLNAAAVKEIAESIKRIGLRTPITVMVTDPNEDIPDYRLVSGLHRLEAMRSLGQDEIEAYVTTDTSEDAARMWEIAENLHRAELTVLQKAEHVAEWVRLSETVSAQLAPKIGRPESGTNKASRELGIDRTEAQRSIKVDSLSPEAKEAARTAGLDDNQSALLRAARVEPERQAATIREIAEARASKIDRDVKDRAANEVAQIIAEYVPGEWWDALKANLYAAGASNIANALTNTVGQSIMDHKHAR